MGRLSKEQWSAVRASWEEDPVVSYVEAAQRVSAKHGFEVPSKAAISKKALLEHWSKTGELAIINEAAQRRADALDVDPEVDDKNFNKIVAREESERLRAEVLARHRREWSEMEGFRRSALIKLKEAYDFKGELRDERQRWIIAKLAADAVKVNFSSLALKQDGEVKAWGLGFNFDVKSLTDEQLDALIEGHLPR